MQKSKDLFEACVENVNSHIYDRCIVNQVFCKNQVESGDQLWQNMYGVPLDILSSFCIKITRSLHLLFHKELGTFRVRYIYMNTFS